MHTPVAILFGVMLGFLAASLVGLGFLIRCIESDVPAFTKWLDKGGVL